ncbi:MAG: UPF0164 family protein [Calditrichaeota bacterium]|nr:UPF0164 family protein [Calditrichota bacterium]
MRIFFLIFLIQIMLFGAVHAGDRRAGLSSNLFLRAELSPRASAMGGAYSALGNDIHAVFYNPAGLVLLKRAEVGFVHVQWFEDIRMQNISLGFKIDPKLAAAFSVSYLGMPDIQGKDRYGQKTEKLGVNSSIIQMNIAYKIHPSFYVGLGIKYFRDDLAGFVASGMAFDLGFLMETFVKGLSVAGVVRNFGSKIRYDQSSEPIPLTYRLGLGYRLPVIHLRLGVEAVRSDDRDWYVSTGLEYSWKDFAFLRVGNPWMSGSGFQPSFGAGIRPTKDLSIDYTLFNHQNLGLTHRIGVNFRFSLFKEKSWSKSEPVGLLTPPDRVYAFVRSDKIKIEWSDVPGAQYNIYVRKSNDSEWKKVYSRPLWAHEAMFGKPKAPFTIDIAVTSVVNGRESSFSRIVTVEIK